MNLAMWSGPRNLSTALMYSFAQRTDFDVVDEPFYGAYLKATGDRHPMCDQITTSMETDPARIAAKLKGARRLYSKQMTHHLLPGMPRDWFNAHRHAFLIRHPARVIASYAAKRERPSIAETGLEQQAAIFDQLRSEGHTPVVVDSFDIRSDPEGTLRKLCAAFDLEWQPAMLTWPKGGNPADGVWARHWYGAVHASTGFSAPEKDLPAIDPDLQYVLDATLPYYTALSEYRI